MFVSAATASQLLPVPRSSCFVPSNAYKAITPLLSAISVPLLQLQRREPRPPQPRFVVTTLDETALRIPEPLHRVDLARDRIQIAGRHRAAPTGLEFQARDNFRVMADADRDAALPPGPLRMAVLQAVLPRPTAFEPRDDRRAGRSDPRKRILPRRHGRLQLVVCVAV